MASTLGSPVGAPTWYFPGGGTSDERDEYLTFFNFSEEVVTFDVIALANGQILPIQDSQGLTIAAGGRQSIRLGDLTRREELPIVILADGPLVVERGLYRVGGTGISQSMGIPLAEDIVVPDPINT